MADFTLTSRAFPNGTTVKAYPVSNWSTPNIPSGAPVGSASDEGTMTSGEVTFEELTQGAEYWAAASVGGTYRYVKFIAGADLASASTATALADSGLAIREYDAGAEEWPDPPVGYAGVVWVGPEAVSNPENPADGINVRLSTG